jgi:hypothetical protein
MITYVGELTLGGSMPGADACAIAGAAGINGALPDIQARIAALQAFAPSNVDFAAQLQLAQSIVASIQTSIALGLTPPSIAAQIAQVMTVINSLLATVLDIEGQLNVILDFQAALMAAGVQAFAYDGPAGSLGSELDAALAPVVPGTDHANAMVLVTTVPGTWDAMAAVFKVSP